MERLAMTLKNLLSLLALALFVSPHQACKSGTTKRVIKPDGLLAQFAK